MNLAFQEEEGYLSPNSSSLITSISSTDTLYTLVSVSLSLYGQSSLFLSHPRLVVSYSILLR